MWQVSDKVSDKSIGNANLSDTEKQILSYISKNSNITQRCHIWLKAGMPKKHEMDLHPLVLFVFVNSISHKYNQYCFFQFCKFRMQN